MSLILTDSVASTYTFPATFTIRSLNYKKKTKQLDIAFRDGGREIGDDKMAGRVIQIEGLISDNATYLSTIQTLYSWLNKVSLKLTIDTGKYINVDVITDISNDFYEGGFERVSKIKFSCVCTDPFFYSTSLTTDTKTISASPTTWVIANAGLYEEFPIIEITNSANNPSLEVENTTDSSRLFDYIDPAFLNTNVLTVDNSEGTVFKGAVNNIDKFSGSFLRLLVGNNTIKYTGANCTMIIKWYKREL